MPCLLRVLSGSLLVLSGLLALPNSVCAQKLAIPRAQDRPPGPALSPAEAVAKMVVPEGFSVEIVAAEPQIANPVGMCIDERGRFWVTESFEYPRREAGPGRDRIKVLEDTDGDGQVDKVTIFAEGLNIPSGIAVGHGGVWVANAPDILFLQDTDGDGKADKQTVVVTGFGRADTHELPNSLTWGPDGWLYGLNGVFNDCHVTYGTENPNFQPNQKPWDFTCALWRIHPRTHEFELYCEGTSNPWGVAINDEGDFFESACVIDHLWHLADTAYYIRQGGPYPPQTWPAASIVRHGHQKAAYCGITWFDSDAYPAEYRNVLYMGNIHGGCINADVLERSGSTYFGKQHPGFPAKPGTWAADTAGTLRKEGTPEKTVLKDFLTANDAWFMPVVQKTGPDGCLYILDWYDRYHCYQDANADPEGIERKMGRLYRVRYRETPHVQPFDLAKESDDQLLARLDSPNVYYRETAQRLLQERRSDALVARLQQLVLKDQAPFDRKRRHALFALIGCVNDPSGTDDRASKLASLLSKHGDPWARSWGLRLHAAQRGRLKNDSYERAAVSEILAGLTDSDPRVRLQAAALLTRTAQLRVPSASFVNALTDSLSQSADDPLLPKILWVSCRSLVERAPEDVGPLLTQLIAQPKILARPAGTEVVRRLIDHAISHQRYAETAMLIQSAIQWSPPQPAIAQQCLNLLTEKVQSGEINAARLAELQPQFRPSIEACLKQSDTNLRLDAALFAVVSKWDDPKTVESVRSATAQKPLREDQRMRAVTALISATDPQALTICSSLLDDATESNPLKAQVLAAMSRSNSPQVAVVTLERYGQLPPELQPKAMELLTQRAEWSNQLLQQIAEKKLPKDALNLNQVQRVASFRNEALQKLTKEIYGAIREGRNPDREQMINKTRDFLYGTPGDPVNGHVIFKKVCAQCHKIYGEGAEVGPDVTANGRASFEQILSNVLDPSLVIGNAYQARLLQTSDGRTLTGLLVEETPERVVLKVQGGKLETIPRSEIEGFKVSTTSMMPEQLEKQITPQELADLFAFIGLDKPPSDPLAKRLPGVPTGKK